MEQKLQVIKITAIIINIIIVLLECYILKSIKKKKDIFKYYTYFQNLLLLLASIIYLVFININSELARGIRYIATTGALVASIIYIVFLSNNKENKISKKDIKSKLSPKMINFLLHGLCPALALLNYGWYEKYPIQHMSDMWTGIAPLPSIIYMVCFMYLVSTNKMKNPYELKSKNKIVALLSMISIPFIFIITSYFLWQLP